MNKTTDVSGACDDALDDLLRSHSIRLGGRQRRRLAWLAARCGDPVLWDRNGPSLDGRRLVIVVEPPSGPRAELFYRSLHADCVVVIPFGENAAFDFLKAKLKDFGTIGPSGADGPHEMWWGGVSWPAAGDAAAPMPLIASCHPRDSGKADAARLARALDTLGLDHVIESVRTASPKRLSGAEKADFILDVWRRHDRPVLWIEPDAVVTAPPALLQALDCDFAAHKWNRWEMSGRTLYFGRSSVAETMLRTWQCLASSYPAVWEGYVLDQTWSLISSQMPLETLWLPRAYHSASADHRPRKPPVIVHRIDTVTDDLGPDPDFPRALRVARRASRTGAPEPLVIIKSPEGVGAAVTVLLRDVQSAAARDVAASIEAVTRAFVADPAGFGHLELALCAWQEDVRLATSAANFTNNRIFEITPADDVPEDLFRRFADVSGASSRNVIPLGGRGRSGTEPPRHQPLSA